MWEKALDYLVAAAQKAQQAYANQEALTHYDRALAVCARPGHTVEPATLLRLYAGKGAVHFLRSEFLPSINAYQRLREVAGSLGTGPRRLRHSTRSALGTTEPTRSSTPSTMPSRRRP